MSDIQLTPRLYSRLRVPVDISIAVLALIVLLPVFLIIGFIIQLDSPGPVFFLQWRIGRRGKPFRVIKFRTMYVDAPKYSLKIADDDPRITRVGRTLRRTGIDELPQLWNVLFGEMALIGPRPEQLEIWSRYAEAWQNERHLVRPGITGLWQINHRNCSPLHLNMHDDVYYVRNQGVRLDAMIVLKTLQVLVDATAVESFESKRPTYIAPSPPLETEATDL